MNHSASSSFVHLWLDIKRQLLEYSRSFAKPHCMCLTTLPQHQSFWETCERVFQSVNKLVSLVMQIVYEPCDCLCVVEPQTLACFDSLTQLSQCLFVLLDRFKNHQQQGFTLSMVQDDQLSYNLDSIAKRAHRVIHKLLAVLQRCSHGHESIISDYNVCDMEQ